ncbi:hypothetical protein R1sor_005551 [Riccia sorocarpa]|uniref:Peroxidase n=1 Tax=Riccia sorocarpa TaxID=122646 RepID=A0ABD3HNR3_9MARC
MGRVRAVSLWMVLVASSIVTIVHAARVDLQQFSSEVSTNFSTPEEQINLELGLAVNFYSKSCPNAETIISQLVSAAINNDKGIAPGLLRIFFHDCFSQGCDASLLLRDSRGSELNDAPNASIRRSALNLIDQIKAALERTCQRVVSCADIIVAATRDSIKATGGPSFAVPLGRRDSFNRFSTGLLPGASATFGDQLGRFQNVRLNTQDLVALASGGHTLGVAQCASFQQRISPNVDPKLNKDFANALRQICGNPIQSSNTAGLDFFSPFKFDNDIFKNFLTGGALLQSDQNMDTDSTAWGLVNTFAKDQGAFFRQFQASFIKMSQINPLSGNNGEIRSVCSRSNNAGFEPLPEDVVQGEEMESPVERDFIKQVTDEE